MLLIKRNGNKTGGDNCNKACFRRKTPTILSGIGKKRSLTYFRECYRKIQEDSPNFLDDLELYTTFVRVVTPLN